VILLLLGHVVMAVVLFMVLVEIFALRACRRVWQVRLRNRRILGAVSTLLSLVAQLLDGLASIVF